MAMADLVRMSVAGAVMVLVVVLVRALLLGRLPKRVFTVLWALVALRLLVPLWIPAPTSVYNLAGLVQGAWDQVQASAGLGGGARAADAPAGTAGEVAPLDAVGRSSGLTVPASTVGLAAAGFSGSPADARADGMSAEASGSLTAANAPGSASVAGLADVSAVAPAAPGLSDPAVADVPASAAGLSDLVPADGAVSPWVVVWAVGALACGSVFAVSYGRMRRRLDASVPVDDPRAERWLARHCLRRPVALRRSVRVGSPITYGVLRPTVVVPWKFDWSNERQVDCALTHELVHIRRFDVVLKLAFVAAACVHWFNPLAWVMLVLANRDIEFACDETAVRSLGTDARAAYAHTLLDLEESRGGLVPLASGLGRTAIEKRIGAIMSIRKTSAAALVASAALVIGIPAAFATAAAPTVATSAGDAAPAAADGGDAADEAAVPDGGATPTSEEASGSDASAFLSAEISLADYDLPETTYAFSDEEWTTIIGLWEAIQDESVSVEDFYGLVEEAGLGATDAPEFSVRIGDNLRLNEARYTNDLAAFICNMLWPATLSVDGMYYGLANDSVSFEVDGGVAGLYYSVTPVLNSDPSVVSAYALYDTVTHAMNELHTLLDEGSSAYITLGAYVSDPLAMGYMLDDVVEQNLVSDSIGVDLEVRGQYTFRPAGSSEALPAWGIFDTTVPGAHVPDFEWPVNENGQTYGSASDLFAYLPSETSTISVSNAVWYSLLPDLVAYVGDNGVSGYVLKKDYYSPDGDFPPAWSEAITAAVEAGDDSWEYVIPVYAEDGETVVDSITMGGTLVGGEIDPSADGAE